MGDTIYPTHWRNMIWKKYVGKKEGESNNSCLSFESNKNHNLRSYKVQKAKKQRADPDAAGQ